MYTPAHVDDGDPVMLGTFSKNSAGLLYHGLRLGAPTSVSLVSQRIYFTPFYTSRGYSLARWWWQNGATVGTNNAQAGIYDENFNLFASCTSTLSAGTANQLQFVSASVQVPPMRGYLAFWCNGTTATFFGRSLADVGRGGIFIQSSAASGLPSTATPASASVVGIIVNHGFTRSTSP